MTATDSKIEKIQKTLKKIEAIKDLEYKIIIVENSYFFYVDKPYINQYYESGEEGVKGWYAGILSLTREDSPILHIFLSKILYDHTDLKSLLLKILIQILIYMNPSLSKLKYKKFKKNLTTHLINTIPKGLDIDRTFIHNHLDDREDNELSKRAEAIIPHMTLYNMIDKLPTTSNLVYLGIDDVKTLLQPFEYMTPHLNHRHHHHHHHHSNRNHSRSI